MLAYTGCLVLSPAILSQFALKMCAAAKMCKKFTKTSFGGFKVIDVNKSKKPIASACYDKQHKCTYLHPFSRYTIQYQKNNHF